jgi:hypothetical protein
MEDGMKDKQIATGDVVLSDRFERHRIKGHVAHAAAKGIDPEIDIPLISHVDGKLWQGGCKDNVPLPDEFDFVLSLYRWESYRIGKNTQRMIVTMYDSLAQGFEQVNELAEMVQMRLDRGETVLVHCQAGLNRSGLLTARVLMLQGYTAADAIALLREKRSPLVLCNDAFETWLLDHDEVDGE